MQRQLLDAAAVATALANLPGWRRDGDALVATYRFADFRAAFAFMTAVALEAEARQHHPDWQNSYSRVEIRLTTHDTGGITEKDLELAGIIAVLAARAGGNGPAAG